MGLLPHSLPCCHWLFAMRKGHGSQAKAGGYPIHCQPVLAEILVQKQKPRQTELVLEKFNIFQNLSE